MLFNSYSYEILYEQFHLICLHGDIKLLLVTVNNRLQFEIKIVHDLSCHPIVAIGGLQDFEHPLQVLAIAAAVDILLPLCFSVFRAVSILPNRIIGTVGEHPGFPVEALSLSHCGQWLASCSHDQLVKFADVREVLAQKVDGHKRLKWTEQRKVLSSKAAAELDFFGDLDTSKGETSKQAGDDQSSEDDSCDSEYDDVVDEEMSSKGKSSRKSRAAGARDVADSNDKGSGNEDAESGNDDGDSQDSSDDDDDDDD